MSSIKGSTVLLCCCGVSLAIAKLFCVQIAEKLWCQVISSYNLSIKCGTERNPLTGKMEPNITSLEEMASFCDKILRKQYDEGMPINCSI